MEQRLECGKPDGGSKKRHSRLRPSASTIRPGLHDASRADRDPTNALSNAWLALKTTESGVAVPPCLGARAVSKLVQMPIISKSTGHLG